MRGEKATTMFPKPGPDLFEVGLWHFQSRKRVAREELKSPLAMNRRQGRQLWFYFEKKHQPVTLSLKGVFADDASQVQVEG